MQFQCILNGDAGEPDERRYLRGGNAHWPATVVGDEEQAGEGSALRASWPETPSMISLVQFQA
jgi:hypothetical protein